MAHNDPSGRLEPSASEGRATEALRDAADTVGLHFMDHVIVTDTAWSRVP